MYLRNALMDKRAFSEQITAAIQNIGAKEAAGLMARSLIVLAHASGADLKYSSDQGVVSIERQVIPDSSKH